MCSTIQVLLVSSAILLLTIHRSDAKPSRPPNLSDDQDHLPEDDNKFLEMLGVINDKEPEQMILNWRPDLRCGPKYNLSDGQPSQCNPSSDYPCCSEFGWCGNTPEHCTCDECKDYSRPYLRCGPKFPNSDGQPSKCDPNSEYYYCCSQYGWCGNTKNHCLCDECINYKDNSLCKDKVFKDRIECDAELLTMCPQSCATVTANYERICNPHQISTQDVAFRIMDVRDELPPLFTMGGMAALYNSRTIMNSSTFICGASLLTQRYLVTAAHCVIEQKKESLSLSLGRSHLDCPGSPDNTYRIQNITIHPAYNRGKSSYSDLALLRTDRIVNLQRDIWVFCLPEVSQQFKNNDILEIAGWGQMNYRKSSRSSTLQTAKVPIVENSKCEENFQKIPWTLSEYPEGLNHQVLCAGGDGVRACKGDSGGPLLHKNEYGQQILIGIISTGIEGTGCPRGTPRNPSFYTNVAAHLDWITEITGKLQSSTTNICGLPPNIDFCNTLDNICAPNAICQNTQPGYICKCKQGFSPNPTPQDACEQVIVGIQCLNDSDCVTNSACINDKCTCREGFQEQGIVCLDVNECQSDDNLCGANAICTNKPGGYQCICNSGFIWNPTKASCQAECSGDCGIGRCTSPGRCTCYDGWSGPRCDCNHDSCRSYNPR